MIKTLFILGRLPALGTAELESLYGADKLTKLSEYVVGLDLPSSAVNFARLGGSIKMCDVLAELKDSRWSNIESEVIKDIAKFTSLPRSGKLHLGLSVYDLNIGLSQLKTSAMKIKQTIKEHSQSVRLVPNQELQLSSAQVFHNNLYADRGVELVIVGGQKLVFVAKTVSVQNISAYAQRDQARPKRDSRVGMLPPKLAQILINLSKPEDDSVILDPFCGTGVVLQEAALMSYKIYGTDIEPRMIEYSETNLDWLKNRFDKPRDWLLEVADATNYSWQDFGPVVSETYLGQAFSAFPGESKLQSVMKTCNSIAEKFLSNIQSQIRPDQRLSLALPAWKLPGSKSFKHLPLVDYIERLGYNRVSFSHVPTKDLIYYRPDQIVARELIIMTRK